MDIDLNKFKIEVAINDLTMNEQLIKLPITEDSLKHALLNKGIVEKEIDLNYNNFNITQNSVTRINKLEEIKVEIPTNIYYLNLYLLLLQKKKILLKTDLTLSTDFIIKEIGRIAEIDNKENLTYKDYYKEVFGIKKPMFSIKQLQKKYQERKGL